jgi:hypothetical protein
MRNNYPGEFRQAWISYAANKWQHAFRSFWWGIPITLVTVFVMGTVANIFNPKYPLTLPEETAAHKERD